MYEIRSCSCPKVSPLLNSLVLITELPLGNQLNAHPAFFSSSEESDTMNPSTGNSGKKETSTSATPRDSFMPFPRIWQLTYQLTSIFSCFTKKDSMFLLDIMNYIK